MSYSIRLDESPRYVVSEKNRQGAILQTWTFKSASAAEKFVADMEEADGKPARLAGSEAP